MKILGNLKLLPLALAAPVVFSLTSCSTTEDDPYAWEENAFLQSRPPAYGYGGGAAPSTGSPYSGGRTLNPGQYPQSRGGTMYLPSGPPPQQPAPQQAGADSGWVPFWQRRGGADPSVSSNRAGARSNSSASGSRQAPAQGTTSPASTGGANEPMITPPSLGGGSSSSPSPSTSKPTTSGHPYGVAVPGKYGYVYSPHDPEKRYVDVTDIPTGTEVRCPYTKKIFLVP